VRPAPHRLRARLVGAVLIAVTTVSVSACSASDTPNTGTGSMTPGPNTSREPRTSAPRSTAPPAALRNPVLVAAGDIACSPFDDDFNASMGKDDNCRQRATSDLIGALHPAAVMPLGDTQYEHGSYRAYIRSYGLTWGRFFPITHPVIGDHEYVTPHAAGYFAYFGRAAGDPNKGYYSYNLGRWHIVALNNSGCAEIGGCGAGSAEERWLKADLAANPARCTLAAWHEPRFSSGKEESITAAAAMWTDLYRAGVEISLAGNDHDYERFTPLDATGRADSSRGVREFVVGTGGVGLRGFKSVVTGSVIRQSTNFGVLALTLRPTSYDWKFVAVGGGFHDSGHGTCH
jgi:hypothetical protein